MYTIPQKRININQEIRSSENINIGINKKEKKSYLCINKMSDVVPESTIRKKLSTLGELLNYKEYIVTRDNKLTKKVRFTIVWIDSTISKAAH